MGGTAFILQNWAIAMVPFGLLAIVFSLEGTKDIFLLVFAILLSSKFPKILKEQISREIIFQKIAAVLLIGSGLTILALI